jgi:hypothetical protein
MSIKYFPYQLVLGSTYTSIAYNTFYLNSSDNQLLLKYTASSFDFKDYYTSTLSSNGAINSTDLYPLAIRYVDEMQGIYVIERPPFKVDIDFSSRPSNRSRVNPSFLANKQMWIPWTVTIINFDKENIRYDLDIYFNNKPLESLDDLVLPALLPNISNGKVCMGNNPLPKEDIYNKSSDQVSVVNLYNFLFNSYFMGNWNSDLLQFIPNIKFFQEKVNQICSSTKKIPSGFSQLDEWQFYSSASYLTKSLFLFSHLSLEELFEYIEFVKQDTINSNSRYKTSCFPFRQRLSSYADLMKDVTELDYSNPTASALKSNYNSLSLLHTPRENRKFAVVNLTLNNFSQSLLSTDSFLYSLVSNPFTLAHIYKTFHDPIYAEEVTNPYGASIYSEIDYQDISHYISTEEQNANSN